MIEHAIILSLTITAIYVVFMPGMILGWVKIIMANIFDGIFGLQWSRYLQKPVWDCLACMSLLWTILLTWDFDLKLILIVCGLNTIISKFLDE